MSPKEYHEKVKRIFNYYELEDYSEEVIGITINHLQEKNLPKFIRNIQSTILRQNSKSKNCVYALLFNYVDYVQNKKQIRMGKLWEKPRSF